MKRMIIACALLLLAQPGLAAETIEKRADLKNGATVQIVNVSGSIEVEGWRKGEIEVIAELGDEAESLIFEPDGNSVLVKVEMKNRKGERHSYPSSGSYLKIRVPFETHLKIKSVSANVTVKDVRGDQRIRTVSANINTRVEGEEAELRAVSGNVNVTGKGKVGKYELYSVSGNVVASELAGEVWAESVSGDVELNGRKLSEVHFKTVSGDIEGSLGLNKGARLQMESVSGDVEVRIPKDYEGEYELTSFSGGIEGLYGNRPTRKSKYAPGSELNFVHGNDKARIRANTLSGDIDISPTL